MSAVSPSSAESGKAFDTDEDEPIDALPNGELDAISRFRREGIEHREKRAARHSRSSNPEKLPAVDRRGGGIGRSEITHCQPPWLSEQQLI